MTAFCLPRKINTELMINMGNKLIVSTLQYSLDTLALLTCSFKSHSSDNFWMRI